MAYRISILLIALLLLSESSSAQLSTQNLLCHLKFDGTVSDETGRCIAASDSFNYGLSRKDKVNGSLLLKTGNGFIQYRDSNIFETKKRLDLTISFWVKTDNNSIGLFAKEIDGEANKQGIRIDINNLGNLVFICMDNGLLSKKSVGLSGKKNIADGKWHHVAGVIEKSERMYLYTDGVLDTSANIDAFPKLDITDFFIIGNKNQSTPFSLFIDGFKIHGAYASSKDVERLYNSDVNPYNIMVWLNNPNSASNSCTFLLNISPNGEGVMFNTGKFEKMAGYSISFIDKKLKTLERFEVNKQDYFFDIRKWGGFDIYFMQVFDPNGDLDQVTKINLTE